jgi:hypothetical protein
MLQRIVDKVEAALTVNAALQTTAVKAPEATYVAFQVVASASSSPVGTAIQVQGSIDGTNFANLGSAVNVTGNGAFMVAISGSDCAYKHYRLSYTRSSGSYVATTSVLFKGEQL